MGCRNRTTAVSESVVSTEATSSNHGRQMTAGTFGSRTRFIVNATSFDVTGEPSSHLRPWDPGELRKPVRLRIPSKKPRAPARSAAVHQARISGGKMRSSTRKPNSSPVVVGSSCRIAGKVTDERGVKERRLVDSDRPQDSARQAVTTVRAKREFFMGCWQKDSTTSKRRRCQGLCGDPDSELDVPARMPRARSENGRGRTNSGTASGHADLPGEPEPFPTGRGM